MPELLRNMILLCKLPKPCESCLLKFSHTLIEIPSLFDSPFSLYSSVVLNECCVLLCPNAAMYVCLGVPGKKSEKTQRQEMPLCGFGGNDLTIVVMKKPF